MKINGEQTSTIADAPMNSAPIANPMSSLLTQQGAKVRERQILLIYHRNLETQTPTKQLLYKAHSWGTIPGLCEQTEVCGLDVSHMNWGFDIIAPSWTLSSGLD